jgi:predicted nucleic acid-binding protein
VLVAILTEDVLTQRAEELLPELGAAPVVTDLAQLEFASVVALRLRDRRLTGDEARAALLRLDLWGSMVAQRVPIETADIGAADDLIRRLELSLRAADAIHLAVAMRRDLKLATFDRQLAAAAVRMGVKVVAG